ncbi:MAG: ERF family protein [Sulfuritalea sp.]|nr:ERF family protein [Sulfuritalea sp.]
MNVYQAINAVQADLSQVGIAKNRTNTQGAGFKFRGIDDVLNALSPLLAKHGLVIIPRVISRWNRWQQQVAAAAWLSRRLGQARSPGLGEPAEDGSKTSRMIGEAMDSGDKATNKAMSAAYKYAAFQTFAIPTEGTPDADAETHEVIRGMDPHTLADWLQAIEQCDDDSFAAMVADGLAAAQEVRDREAWVAIRAAGKKREGATT